MLGSQALRFLLVRNRSPEKFMKSDQRFMKFDQHFIKFAKIDQHFVKFDDCESTLDEI